MSRNPRSSFSGISDRVCRRTRISSTWELWAGRLWSRPMTTPPTAPSSRACVSPGNASRLPPRPTTCTLSRPSPPSPSPLPPLPLPSPSQLRARRPTPSSRRSCGPSSPTRSPSARRFACGLLTRRSRPQPWGSTQKTCPNSQRRCCPEPTRRWLTEALLMGTTSSSRSARPALPALLTGHSLLTPTEMRLRSCRRCSASPRSTPGTPRLGLRQAR